MKLADLNNMEVKSQAELRTWLSQNHQSPQSHWLITHKKDAGTAYVCREQVLDELIAHGWIDGRRLKVDETRTAQLISQRQTQAWSQSYKDRAERLISEGKMAAPGLASIEAGKASGLWDFYADVDALIIPEDLEEAFDAQGKANFQAFAPSAQRFTLRWIKLAKTSATRAKRITETADRAARNEFVDGVRMPSKT